jgi:hypothetical protein
VAPSTGDLIQRAETGAFKRLDFKPIPSSAVIESCEITRKFALWCTRRSGISIAM